MYNMKTDIHSNQDRYLFFWSSDLSIFIIFVPEILWVIPSLLYSSCSALFILASKFWQT